jgi:hypothetical protein
MNEEAMVRVGPQRHKKKKYFVNLATKIIKTNLQNYLHPQKITMTFPCTDDVNYCYYTEGWFEYIKIRNSLIKM